MRIWGVGFGVTNGSGKPYIRLLLDYGRVRMVYTKGLQHVAQLNVPLS